MTTNTNTETSTADFAEILNQIWREGLAIVEQVAAGGIDVLDAETQLCGLIKRLNRLDQESHTSDAARIKARVCDAIRQQIYVVDQLGVSRMSAGLPYARL